MKNLENYGVQEMNTQEMKETDGGNPIAFVGLWLAWEIATNPQNTWDTLVCGFNSYER